MVSVLSDHCRISLCYGVSGPKVHRIPLWSVGMHALTFKVLFKVSDTKVLTCSINTCIMYKNLISRISFFWWPIAELDTLSSISFTLDGTVVPRVNNSRGEYPTQYRASTNDSARFKGLPPDVLTCSH